MPETITSDVLPVPGVDRVCSALDMPFAQDSLSAIFLLNVFHHIPDAKLFFKEVARCLKPGGRLILVERANTVWSRWVYRHFHHEPFDTATKHWTLPYGGRLSGANGALPWIVFVRDRQKFRKLFPDLSVERIELCHPFRYLVSGGVSARSMVPDFAYPFVAGLEWILEPLNRYLAMFMRVVVVKSTGHKGGIAGDGRTNSTE
jgi:SAM-dependent methyltransferase